MTLENSAGSKEPKRPINACSICEARGLPPPCRGHAGGSGDGDDHDDHKHDQLDTKYMNAQSYANSMTRILHALMLQKQASTSYLSLVGDNLFVQPTVESYVDSEDAKQRDLELSSNCEEEPLAEEAVGEDMGEQVEAHGEKTFAPTPFSMIP